MKGEVSTSLEDWFDQPMSIRRQIAEAVKWRGVTAPMLADAMSVHRSVAHRLATGQKDMRISTLERLANALGYEVQLVRKRAAK